MYGASMWTKTRSSGSMSVLFDGQNQYNPSKMKNTRSEYHDIAKHHVLSVKTSWLPALKRFFLRLGRILSLERVVKVASRILQKNHYRKDKVFVSS